MLQREIAIHTKLRKEHETAIMAMETTIRLNQEEIRRPETAGKEISAKIELLFQSVEGTRPKRCDRTFIRRHTSKKNNTVPYTTPTKYKPNCIFFTKNKHNC